MNESGIAQNTTNESVAPGQPNQDDSLIDEIVNNLYEGRNHWSNWRRETRDAYDFFAGVQWSKEDSAKLDDEGRPVVVFNRIPRTINAITGIEIQNREEVRFLPRVLDSSIEQQNNPLAQTNQDLNDSGYADAMTDAAKWARDESDAEDEESDAFQDSLICGCGWTETRVEYEVNPDGEIKVDRIDPLEMLVDPNSKKKNFVDAKWIARILDIPKREFERLFPEWAPYITVNTFWNDYSTTPHNADKDFLYKEDQSDKMSKANTISVAQYQYYEVEDYYKILDVQTGQIVEFDKNRFNKIKKFLEANNYPYSKFKKRIYRQAFITGRFLLKHADLKSNDFTFNGITGLRDRNRNYWFGVVQLMMDPQRWANKWLSQIQYILNTNAAGGAFIEEGALANPRKAEDDWARPDAMIELNDGGLQKIQERTARSYPDGIDKLLQYAIQSINDIPGINLEILGQANRDQAVAVELSRKQAGITILATFFDSLRRYRKMQGRVLAFFIREYISDGRLIRILGSEGAKYIPLIKDSLAFQYDIIVDDAPTSMNSKTRIFSVINQVLPLALQSNIPIPPDILDYMPLPETLIQQWKKLISDQSDNSQQQELEMINKIITQLKIEKEQAEIQKISSETAMNYSKAQHDQALAANESQGNIINHNIKLNEIENDQQRKDLELLLNQRRKMLEVQLDARIRSLKNVSVPSLSEIQ